ncbi:MAG: hypothetical protein AMXMBFR13_26770 [Phycisphaerae bacterium]
MGCFRRTIACGLVALAGSWMGCDRRSEDDSAAYRPTGREVLADFSLPDLQGRTVSLKEYAAGRPLLLSFGTTNCPWCNRQIQAFKQIREQYGDRVAILEVNVQEPASVVSEHMRRIESPFTTLLDEDGSVYGRYGTGGVPVTIVADSRRRILEIGGYLDPATLSRLLDGALGSPAS